MKSLKDFKLSVQVGAGSSKVSYGPPHRPAPMDILSIRRLSQKLTRIEQQHLNLSLAFIIWSIKLKKVEKFWL